MKDVAVIIMSYRSPLTEFEQISFERCINVFSKRDIFLVSPWDIPKDEYIKMNNNKANITFFNFDPKWFKSTVTYSKMLMQKWFYKLFLDYKYILIYQLDCYAFQDNLDYFMGLDYDYYGAPWVWCNVFRRVGNGGFSLRKVSAMLENLEERNDLDYINSDECNDLIEDFAYCTSFYPLKNICPFEIADKFSFETNIFLRDADQLSFEDFPMGLHGFSKDNTFEYEGEFFNLKNDMEKAIKRWEELKQLKKQ